MQQNLIRFPEVLIIDSKFNANRFNLVVFDGLVVDNYGLNKPTFFSFLSSNSKEKYSWALGLVKKIHNDIKVIYSDEEVPLI